MTVSAARMLPIVCSNVPKAWYGFGYVGLHLIALR